MQIKNPLLLSAFVVFTFWYLVGLLGFALVSPFLAQYLLLFYPMALAVISVGAGCGLALTLGVEWADLYFKEREIRAGHEHRGLQISLGRVPGADAETKEKAA